MDFKLVAPYKPSGDQPQAIAKLTKGLLNKKQDQILLGVTGSGKTYTIANVIAEVNRPTLIIAHNKTLAAQLCAEFRAFFPENAVEYFVSYYDYYQPEAYVPSRDIYIEKEADINEEIEKLRHRATRALFTRKDVIIVASVSCIYGLGAPEDYLKGIVKLKVGAEISRRSLLESLQNIQYERNDIELRRGRYRIHGEIIDIYPVWDENLIRLEFFGDELEAISTVHPVSGTKIADQDAVDIFPATHYVVNESLDRAVAAIEDELKAHLDFLNSQGRIFEAKRVEQRTKYDIEMMREMGYCKGIENYSRHISGRASGSAPGVLLDFFPKDFITVIDESHVTIPQIRGMQHGDYSRKKTLVDFGFRLPSAIDNRPLTFSEFEAKTGQMIYISATPGPYELELVKSEYGIKDSLSIWQGYDLVEQVIRPTGLLDPEVIIKPTKGQIDDVITECHARIAKGERVLITTVTKRLSEDLSGFLDNKNIKVSYLHSEIDALERIDILHDLRAGKFDVLVGVNLLREGLDLPEVSLVIILDADKEGFLRNERSLIQTMGRAARNINGTVILYADKITDSMSKAINETCRRRKIQMDHNLKNNIQPKSIVKELSDIRDEQRDYLKRVMKDKEKISPEALPKLIAQLEKDMLEAAKNLEFEVAAVLRDQLEELKQQPMVAMKSKKTKK